MNFIQEPQYRIIYMNDQQENVKSLSYFRENESLLNIDVEDFHGSLLEPIKLLTQFSQLKN